MTLTPLTRLVARVTFSDLGILLGLGLCGYALFQWSAIVGWFFVGLVVVGLSVIGGLTPTTRAPSAPNGDQ